MPKINPFYNHLTNDLDWWIRAIASGNFKGYVGLNSKGKAILTLRCVK